MSARPSSRVDFAAASLEGIICVSVSIIRSETALSV